MPAEDAGVEIVEPLPPLSVQHTVPLRHQHRIALMHHDMRRIERVEVAVAVHAGRGGARRGPGGPNAQAPPGASAPGVPGIPSPTLHVLKPAAFPPVAFPTF